MSWWQILVSIVGPGSLNSNYSSPDTTSNCQNCQAHGLLHYRKSAQNSSWNEISRTIIFSKLSNHWNFAYSMAVSLLCEKFENGRTNKLDDMDRIVLWDLILNEICMDLLYCKSRTARPNNMKQYWWLLDRVATWICAPQWITAYCWYVFPATMAVLFVRSMFQEVVNRPEILDMNSVANGLTLNWYYLILIWCV